MSGPAAVTSTSLLTSLTSGALSSLTSVLGGNYTLKKTLLNLMTVAIANEGNPSVLNKVVMDIQTTLNCPQAVVNLAPALGAQTSAVGFMQVVQEMETEINKL